MNISLKSASRSLTVVATFLCLGGVLSFVKSKEPLALNIIIASASVAVSSEFISRSNHKKANNQLPDIVANHTKEWQVFNNKFDQQSKVLTETQALRDELQQEFSKAADEIIFKNQTIQILQAKVSQLVTSFEAKTQELEDKLQQEDMRYQELIDVFKGLIVEHLNERIYKFFNSLDESINKKLESEDYQAIHDNLIPFKDKLQLYYDTHCELLKSIGNIDGDLSDIVTDILSIYSRIVDEQTALKTRFRNLLNLDERRSLEDAYNTLADYSKTHTPITKAKDLLGEYSDFQKNQLNNLGEKLEDNVNSLSEMRGQVFDLIAQIEQISLEKVALKDELNKLNQPQVWRLTGGNRELEKGNVIIQYFWSKGIKLDRAFTTGDFYESKIYYHTDNNPRTLVFKELNEHSEALQQLCLTLKPITFDWDADKGLMVASLAWKAREKKDTTKSDIDSIWIPASKFETYVKRWERVRITAGSTGGKSPTAKNLALAIMQSRSCKGEIRLYDPQHGSKKDYWDMPKAGTSHEDNLQGMKDLCQLIDDRRHGHNHQFVLYIFDEVDNTVNQLKEGAKFRDLIKVSLKEGSHADVGVIYIGQSADANEVPGMTHSNWNNAVQLHIGTNAGTAIEKLTTLTTEDKTKLLNQYRKIQEYCDRMNDELGLDIFTDSGAYRFALAVPLTGLPKFIQLPAFDSYDYNGVMSTNTQESLLTNIIAKDKNEDNKLVSMPDIKCTHCASLHFTRKDKVKDPTLYTYLCKSCNKKFVGRNNKPINTN